ncbi:hypothetical protein [Chitinophaga niabensis]|nr:hypothetical protein [Chitinophaga niabensis]
MKSVVVMFVLIVICAAGTNAQGIFNQKGTQLKRLAEQVALLHTYSGYLKKSYRIARDGLNTITDIKNGDFNIHKTFFNSLKAVNPHIRKYSRVAEILLIQVQTLISFRRTMILIERSGMYGEQELEYIKRVFDKVIDSCALILEELDDLVKDGRLELKDDERIQRIDHLYKEMVSTHAFSKEVCREAIHQVSCMEHEKEELELERRLHGVDIK